MVINARRADLVRLQELRDLYVVTVFLAIAVVLNQDQRLFGRAANPVKFSVGATFFDRRNFYFVDIEPRKMQAGLAKQEVGSHESDIDVAMNARGGFSGADNTTKQFGIGSNL